MLSDVDIRRALLSGTIRIDPNPTRHDIQPASVDVNLASECLVWKALKPYDDVSASGFYIDPSKDMSFNMSRFVLPSYVKEPIGSELFLIQPQQFLLAYVQQHIWVPNYLTAFIHGRSSLARYGLFIHITAGLLDAGWNGCATLELYNASPYAIRLWAGMSIATITFQPMSSSAARPYGHHERRSKYQGDNIVVTSRYHEEMISQLDGIDLD